MANLLYRLGRFSFRHRWAVLGVWIVILLGAGTAASTLSGPTSESFSIPGVPALQAFELQQERFAPPGEEPAGLAEGFPAAAQLVFAGKGGLRGLALRRNRGLGYRRRFRLRFPRIGRSRAGDRQRCQQQATQGLHRRFPFSAVSPPSNDNWLSLAGRSRSSFSISSRKSATSSKLR